MTRSSWGLDTDRDLKFDSDIWVVRRDTDLLIAEGAPNDF